MAKSVNTTTATRWRVQRLARGGNCPAGRSVSGPRLRTARCACSSSAQSHSLRSQPPNFVERRGDSGFNISEMVGFCCRLRDISFTLPPIVVGSPWWHALAQDRSIAATKLRGVYLRWILTVPRARRSCMPDHNTVTRQTSRNLDVIVLRPSVGAIPLMMPMT